MDNSGEREQALKLLNHSGRYYHVRRWAGHPDAFGDTIVSARVESGDFIVETEGRRTIRVSVGEFCFYVDGVVHIYASRDDEREVLGLEVPRQDEAFIDLLRAANTALGRGGPFDDRPDGLE